MNRKNSLGLNFLLTLVSLVPLVLLLYYYQEGDKLIAKAYQNQAPSWLEWVVNWFYPRFFTEQHRFPLTFFQDRAWQVILRAVMVWYLGVALWLSYPYWRVAWCQYWSQTIDKRQVSRMMGLFVLFTVFFTWDFPLILSKLSQQSALYSPVFLLKLLGLPFPNKVWIYLTCLLFWATLLGGFLPRIGTVSLVFSVILFLILQGWLNSFHKLDHTYATFTYAIVLLPFLRYEQERNPKEIQQADWALRLIWLSITLAYFFAGIEKVLIGGWQWFAAENLVVHLRAHHTPLGLWVADYAWLCFGLNVGAVLLEVSFPLILFVKPFYKILLLISGILFHLGTFFMLGIGGLISPWMAVYLFFMPSFFRQK